MDTPALIEMLEIEKKYRLTPERREAIVAALDELGGVMEGDETEENVIYGGGVLAETSAIIRIRRTDKRALLTYKRRIESSSDVKQQVEHETEISDPDAANMIIRELQLSPRLVYEKRRSTWRFRNAEIALDELPFGLFMEIEGSQTSIKETEMLLDIEDLEAEPETYPLMTARLGRQVGDLVEARFSWSAK